MLLTSSVLSSGCIFCISSVVTRYCSAWFQCCRVIWYLNSSQRAGVQARRRLPGVWNPTAWMETANCKGQSRLRHSILGNYLPNSSPLSFSNDFFHILVRNWSLYSHWLCHWIQNVTMVLNFSWNIKLKNFTELKSISSVSFSPNMIMSWLYKLIDKETVQIIGYPKIWFVIHLSREMYLSCLCL